MNSLKIVAVASSEEVRLALYNQLQSLNFVEFNGVYIELSEAVRECQQVGPDVIIVDTTGRELDAGLFIQAISMNPENPCAIFALHREMDVNIFKEAIRQGAREFIQYPEDKSSLEVALKRHQALLSKAMTQGMARAHSGASAANIAQAGKIIAVFAAKGGVGATSVATNLAYELHASKGEAVALFDLDQVFCNSAITLAHKPNYSAGDLASNDTKDIDEALLNRIIEKHESGIHLVVGSKSVLDDNDLISPELLERVLDHLESHYAYTIVDLPTHVLDPYHQYVVERAGEVILVTWPDIPSLSRTRQYLDLAQKYLDMKKIKPVLNRYTMKAAYRMSNQQVEDQFQYDIFARLPNDWELNVEASTRGTVWSIVNPKAELAKAMQTLAADLVGESNKQATTEATVDGGKSKGLLNKLFTPKGEVRPQTSKG